MTELTARLALPLLAPGQAQKEMTHNEALAAIDIVVQAGVVGAGLDMPPVAPAAGECWIVGPAPTGAWTGRAGAIAGWTDGGWRFVAPREGLCAWVADEGRSRRFTGGAWTSFLGVPLDAVAAPSGGGVTDVEARSAVVAILDALRHHGLIVA